MSQKIPLERKLAALRGRIRAKEAEETSKAKSQEATRT